MLATNFAAAIATLTRMATTTVRSDSEGTLLTQDVKRAGRERNDCQQGDEALRDVHGFCAIRERIYFAWAKRGARRKSEIEIIHERGPPIRREPVNRIAARKGEIDLPVPISSAPLGAAAIDLPVNECEKHHENQDERQHDRR